MAAITHVHDCFPALLDNPTAKNNGIQDTHLEEEFPDYNFGGGNDYAHYAGKLGKSGLDLHALFLYDINTFIPADAIITAAVWWFHAQFTSDADGHYVAYRLTEDWFEDEATWNDRKTGIPWTTPGADDEATPIAWLSAITTTGWKNYDLLDLAADAWDNRSGILQFLVKRNDILTDEGYISISGKAQYSRWPMYVHHLRITYTLDGRTFQVVLR